MAKKRRSAKQKAATRKLVRFNKSKKKKKAPKRRKNTTKKRNPPRKKTIKKKSAPKRSVAGKKGISQVINNPTLKKVLLAAGAVSVATSVAAVAFPQAVPLLTRPIVKAGLGFLTGDFIGAVSNFVLGGGTPQISTSSNGGGDNVAFA